MLSKHSGCLKTFNPANSGFIGPITGVVGSDKDLKEDCTELTYVILIAAHRSCPVLIDSTSVEASTL